MAIGTTKLGKLLHEVSRGSEVVAETRYPMMGVRSFGRGAFKAADLQGSDTSYARLRRVETNDVVYPKLMAWEGAFAVIQESLDGHFVSPEFCTFEVDVETACPAYIGQLLKSERFMSEVRKSATGTNVRRRRIQPTTFLNIEIPLPDLKEQQRIVRRIRAAEQPQNEAALSSELLAAGVHTYLSDAYRDLIRDTKLSKVLCQRKSWVSVDSESVYPTIGLSKSGRGAFIKPPSHVSATRLMKLNAGDFVYSRLFAWQGSMSLVPESSRPLYGSNEFPAFGIDHDQILPEFLLGWFRQPEVWAEIEKQCTGSTPGSRNRFKESNLLAMNIPVPAIAAQKKVVNGLQEFGQAEKLVARRKELAEALPKSVRNEIFSQLV